MISSIISFVISTVLSFFINKKFNTIYAFLFAIFLLLNLLYFTANYFTADGINDTVIYTLLYGINDAGFSEYKEIIFISISMFFLIVLSSFIYYKYLNKISSHKNFIFYIYFFFISVAFVSNPFMSDIYKIYKSISYKEDFHGFSKDFSKNYKIPKYNGNNNNKNLLFIYAESLEQTYFDNKLFPNIMTNLKKVKQFSTSFTNIQQMPYTGYTIAGMVASQCGIPLIAPYHGNSMSGIDLFYKKATCLGDVLDEYNYSLNFLQGSSVKFSGIDKFHKTHKFTYIDGKNNLLKTLEDKTYRNGWGLYDDTLLDIVYKKFIKLSSLKQPFAIFTATIDTHHTDGQLSKSCKNDLYTDGKNNILNCVKCSDKLLSNLINKIKESPYAKNTIIVLVSDHLAMNNTAYDILEKGIRKDTFLIIDFEDLVKKEISKKGTPFDIGATVLAKLNIANELGLGRDLLSQNSLFDKLGDKFISDLSKWKNDILSFWMFPTIGDYISIDESNETLNIQDSNYKLPVLIKIDKDTKEIKPYFKFNLNTTLIEQLIESFQKDEQFLIIDKCKIINKIYKTKYTTKYCLLQGSLDTKFNIKEIDKNKKYKVIKLLPKNNDNYFKSNQIALGSQYNNTLTEGIEFNSKHYPKFIKQISGLAGRENWGRWSDSRKEKSIIITFKNKLPTNFTLKLKARIFTSVLNHPITIKIGDKKQVFSTKYGNFKEYEFIFKDINSKTIIITPSNTKSPFELMDGRDKRKLGIAFKSLKIIDIFNSKNLLE